MNTMATKQTQSSNFIYRIINGKLMKLENSFFEKFVYLSVQERNNVTLRVLQRVDSHITDNFGNPLRLGMEVDNKKIERIHLIGYVKNIYGVFELLKIVIFVLTIILVTFLLYLGFESIGVVVIGAIQFIYSLKYIKNQYTQVLHDHIEVYEDLEKQYSLKLQSKAQFDDALKRKKRASMLYVKSK